MSDWDTKRIHGAAQKAMSVHNGPWSNAMLVVSAIADGGAAKLALACHGFKSDEEWADALVKEIEQLLANSERYRWWREHYIGSWAHVNKAATLKYRPDLSAHIDPPGQVDRAIDSARAKS